MHKYTLALLIGLLAIFSTGCSLFEEPVAQPVVVQPIMYVITTEHTLIEEQTAQPQPFITYEVGNDGSDASWLIAQSERRTDLNRIRYMDEQADEDELREDMKRSRNWRSVVDGEEYIGYDNIRERKGELEEYPEDEKSDAEYNYVMRFKR